MPRPLPLLVILCLVVAVPSAWLVARARPAPDAAQAAQPPSAAVQRQAPPSAIQPQSAVQAAAALSPRNANYSIDVALDPARRRLSGRELLTWRNTSTISTSELQFHLYYNAWKNTRSTWLREAAALPWVENSRRAAADWGWIEVSAVRLVGSGGAPPIDVTAEARHISPDDGNADDETVLRVPLPRDVAPGETVNVELEWTAQVPRTFARTGAVGDCYFLAQWFPKVGVLEDAGWNCHQFHAGTEFFADYGVYDVRLRVPTGWVVGATGRERERRDNRDGTTTHRYYQEDVHDFAWTTSPDYLVREARFEHPGLPPVAMRLLLQPEHAGQADRHFAATRAALRYYGEWFGAYPYGHITVVDPAWQSGAGGMEYPTLFTGGTRWLAPADVADPEGVTVHEAGHQFWYGMVGNNEFEDAWIDEGFNTFSTGRTMAEAFTPNFQSERFFGGFVPWVIRDIPVSRATDENGLGELSIGRGAGRAVHAVVALLAEGRRPALLQQDRPLAAHARAAPGLADAAAHHVHVLRAVEVPAPEAGGLLRGRQRGERARHDLVLRPGVPKLQRVRLRDQHAGVGAGRRRGLVRPGGPRVVWRCARRRSLPDVRDRPAAGRGRLPGRRARHLRERDQVRERWDGRDRWKRFETTGTSRAVSAQVDPDRVLLLDVNFTNNSRTLRPAAAAATRKWTVKWLVWLQDVLVTYAFFL